MIGRLFRANPVVFTSSGIYTLIATHPSGWQVRTTHAGSGNPMDATLVETPYLVADAWYNVTTRRLYAQQGRGGLRQSGLSPAFLAWVRTEVTPALSRLHATQRVPPPAGMLDVDVGRREGARTYITRVAMMQECFHERRQRLGRGVALHTYGAWWFPNGCLVHVTQGLFNECGEHWNVRYTGYGSPTSEGWSLNYDRATRQLRTEEDRPAPHDVMTFVRRELAEVFFDVLESI